MHRGISSFAAFILVLLYVWASYMYVSLLLLLVLDPCIDGVMNYDETDIDSGGLSVPQGWISMYTLT